MIPPSRRGRGLEALPADFVSGRQGLKIQQPRPRKKVSRKKPAPRPRVVGKPVLLTVGTRLSVLLSDRGSLVWFEGAVFAHRQGRDCVEHGVLFKDGERAYDRLRRGEFRKLRRSTALKPPPALAVGSRLKVLLQVQQNVEQHEWFSGTVVGHAAGGKHDVQYDDGDRALEELMPKEYKRLAGFGRPARTLTNEERCAQDICAIRSCSKRVEYLSGLNPEGGSHDDGLIGQWFVCVCCLCCPCLSHTVVCLLFVSHFI